MLLTVQQSLIIILLIAFITFFIRVTPFLLFPADKKAPEYIEYLGAVLPYAIIGMLIIYCLKGVSISAPYFGLPEIISIIFVVVIYFMIAYIVNPMVVGVGRLLNLQFSLHCC